MNPPAEQAVYRIRRSNRLGDRPRGYRHTLEVSDDRTREILATCDVIGKAALTPAEILDHHRRIWLLNPNRRVMPSRWILTDPGHHTVTQFDQQILGKLVVPLYRVALVLLDGAGNEICRLVDPRRDAADRMFGVGPHEWAIIDGDRLVARLAFLPTEKQPAKGLLAKLANLLTSSDRGIISSEETHALPAPTALGMLMLLDELTDPS